MPRRERDNARGRIERGCDTRLHPGTSLVSADAGHRPGLSIVKKHVPQQIDVLYRLRTANRTDQIRCLRLERDESAVSGDRGIVACVIPGTALRRTADQFR